VLQYKYDHFREERIFSAKIALSMDTDIEFRYFIAVICQSNSTKNSANTLIIRRWETHMTPRLIRKNSIYLLNIIPLIFDKLHITHY